MYKYTDIIIKKLNNLAMRAFDKHRNMLKSDELHVIRSSHALYEELYTQTYKQFVILFTSFFKKYSHSDIDLYIVGRWIDKILQGYNPVTKYIFDNEVDRKRSRLAESIIASTDKNAEYKKALRLWSAMTAQYAIDVTDEAVKQAYIKDGVKYVKWVTNIDGRECSECRDRNGKIYAIDKVPAKPHIGCRCYLVRANEDRKRNDTSN